MANLLTFERLLFLMDKMGWSPRPTPSYLQGEFDSRYKFIVLDDLTLSDTVHPTKNFWAVPKGYKDNWSCEDENSESGVIALYYYKSLDKSDCIADVQIARLKNINAKYPVGTPLYVGTKRVNQAICKVGGYSRRYKAYASNKGATSKRSCRAGVV